MTTAGPGHAPFLGGQARSLQRGEVPEGDPPVTERCPRGQALVSRAWPICALFIAVVASATSAWMAWRIWRREDGHAHAPSNNVYYYFTEPAQINVTDNMEVDHIWITMPTAVEQNGNAVFASMQFHFESLGLGGYFGTQVTRQDSKDEYHQAIFSVWDHDEQHKVGWVGDRCSRFGGEGTGSHCRLKYAFREGTLYTLRIELIRGADAGDLLSGYVLDPNTLEWTTIGTLSLPNLPGFQGFGMLRTFGAISFQEYFEATGCDGQPLSRVGLLGPYFSDRAITPDAAMAGYHPEAHCQHSDASSCIPGYGCGAPRVFYSAGGDTQRTVGLGQNLWNESHVFLEGVGGSHEATWDASLGLFV